MSLLQIDSQNGLYYELHLPADGQSCTFVFFNFLPSADVPRDSQDVVLTAEVDDSGGNQPGFYLTITAAKFGFQIVDEAGLVQ